MDGGIMREYDTDPFRVDPFDDLQFQINTMHTKGEQERIKQGFTHLTTWTFFRSPGRIGVPGMKVGWMLGPSPAELEAAAKALVQAQQEQITHASSAIEGTVL